MRNSDAVVETRSAIPSWIFLGGILLLFAAMSAVGITWGLPSRNIDKYLFGDGEVWSGEKIYRLAKADRKFSPTRGADVDVDPIHRRPSATPSPQPSPLKGEGVSGDEPIPLTATEEDVAKIYLRYRLYTYQPDEMITMMALAGMKPGKLDFDPRLYQYGGLFIYPVGAHIKLCGLLGFIDVRSDVVFYLDNPDEFGKFYIVARAYSAVWGLIGVIVVYAITRRLATHRAGLLAALLFTLMPVVMCMAHEGKPHLPGAVLMLLVVYFAMRSASVRPAIRTPSASAGSTIRAGSASDRSDTGPIAAVAESGPLPDGRGSNGPVACALGSDRYSRGDFWRMCVCCGAALGMVLSSWPVFVLIPLVAFRAAGFCSRDRAIRMLTGTALALGVYFITNPYIVINAFVNREVLKSNFGNSLAMYEIARIGEGFVRVAELTIEGATLPVLLFGLCGLGLTVIRKNPVSLPLIVAAAVFFLQFVLIGAGKPAEYGRFGIFTNTALSIGTACILVSSGTRRLSRWSASFLLVAWVAWVGAAYLRNFRIDTSNQASRLQFAEYITSYQESLRAYGTKITLVVPADPAPYNLPPRPFQQTRVLLAQTHHDAVHGVRDAFWWLIHPVDSTAHLEHQSRDVALQQMIFTDARWRETPISWANKPFVIENTVGVGEANGTPSPAPQR